MTGRARLLIIALIIGFAGCSKDNPSPPVSETKNLTIFFVNDVHGQIENFSKLSYIVDNARASGEVMLVSSGDIFSGNPEVDYYPEKGYPMIDLMNRVGFDAAVTGNHEFDYGQEVLSERIAQADFPFTCANVTTTGSLLPELPDYVTISRGDIEITFIGLVETGGMPGMVIPSTHPARVNGITFTPAAYELDKFSTLKEDEGSDLLVALSHLGYRYSSSTASIGDINLAIDYSLFDLVIGGHSHAKVDTIFNNVPVYQAGGYLNYLGKISLVIKDRQIISRQFDLINLNTYNSEDSQLTSVIGDYQNRPELEEVIGINNSYLSSGSGLGCFYTDALRLQMDADISFQNPGGIRSSINTGSITVREIYEMDPFGNMALKFNMSVNEIRQFLEYSGAGFYYSGVVIGKDGNGNIILTDSGGNQYNEDDILTVAINDYIPAVYSNLFPAPAAGGTMTTADIIIEYIKALEEPVNYPPACNNYFRY